MSGTCSFPGCDWTGLYDNFKKHAFGVGLGKKRRSGKHEGSDCAFLPGLKRAPQYLSSSCVVLYFRQVKLLRKAHLHFRAHWRYCNGTGLQDNRCTIICKEHSIVWPKCNHASSTCRVKVLVRLLCNYECILFHILQFRPTKTSRRINSLCNRHTGTLYPTSLIKDARHTIKLVRQY